MKVSDFDYDLPSEFIAQTPACPRDSSRLLHLDRASGEIGHLHFRDIVNLLMPDDVLVLNNTRVMPARLGARKAITGGKAEILLLRRLTATRWKALIRGRNVHEGTRLELKNGSISCTSVQRLKRGQHVIEFDRAIDEHLRGVGELPLPPYIHSALDDSERYQTIYSSVDGSAAAPTAGLHFTTELIAQLQHLGVKLAYCTLHIGLDTFQPVTVDEVADHIIHSEFATLDTENAKAVNSAIRSGHRVIAVGTTSARTLESAAICRILDRSAGHELDKNTGRSLVTPICGDTDLFIYPGYRWRVVDAMITNFHLPRSTLLMMLSAFAGRETLLSAYEIAKTEAYRFYSFGDAMFIT